MKYKTSPTESRFRCQRNPAPVREADHPYGWHLQRLAALVYLATTPPATDPDQPLPTTRRFNRSSSVYITIPAGVIVKILNPQVLTIARYRGRADFMADTTARRWQYAAAAARPGAGTVC